MEKITVTSRQHLDALVRKEIRASGAGCSLNHIDVTSIHDFSWLFSESEFDGDVSEWNMANARDITAMFQKSYFTGDISGWDVSNVVHAGFLFSHCPFNGDISQWQMGKTQSMHEMFSHSGFSGDLSRWDVSNVRTMGGMFAGSEFNGDLSSWRVNRVQDMSRMFEGLAYTQGLDSWNPARLLDAQAMLSAENLNSMETPCFYHWYAAMAQHYHLPPAWSTHLERVLPLAWGLASTDSGVSILVQEAWLHLHGGKSDAHDSLALPFLEDGA